MPLLPPRPPKRPASSVSRRRVVAHESPAPGRDRSCVALCPVDPRSPASPPVTHSPPLASNLVGNRADGGGDEPRPLELDVVRAFGVRDVFGAGIALGEGVLGGDLGPPQRVSEGLVHPGWQLPRRDELRRQLRAVGGEHDRRRPGRLRAAELRKRRLQAERLGVRGVALGRSVQFLEDLSCSGVSPRARPSDRESTRTRPATLPGCSLP